MSIRKKLIFLLIFIFVLSLMFAAACGQKNGKKEENQTDENQKEMKNEQVITYNLGVEPETLDPATARGKAEATVQMAVFEGLTRLNKENKPVPGMAKDWEINKNGMEYIFHLRDANWTNGDPVTAQDFEYTWKRLLDPETAASYAYQLWYLKNGREFTEGKVDAEAVGVKALDDKTLKVELAMPTPYFLSLTAFPNLYPVNRNVVEADPKWHTKVDTYVTNGPFKISEWEHDQKLVLVKNPDYWAAEDVKLDKIVMTMVGSQNTELTMFETGQIDIAEDPPLSEVKRLLEEGVASLHPDLATLFYAFNVKNEVLQDERVCRALAMAIDRKALIDNVAAAFHKPAYAFVTYGLPGIEGDFREEGGAYFEENTERARQLLEDAGFPAGKGFPELEILCVSRGEHQKIAEAIQEMWKQNLNIDVTISTQEWGVYLQTMGQGDYQVVSAVWGADYLDAMTFLDMFVSGGGNNITGWGNKEYDRLIEIAKNEIESRIRIKALHDAEKILMEEMPIMPIYFYTNVNLYKPWVKGVVVPTIGGYQEFRWAYVEK